LLSVRRDPGMTLVDRAVDGDALDAAAMRVADLPELCRQLDVQRILAAPRDSFAAGLLDIYRTLQASCISRWCRATTSDQLALPPDGPLGPAPSWRSPSLA
jgi:hypothetical protein